jgi:hypothetical protein
MRADAGTLGTTARGVDRRIVVAVALALAVGAVSGSLATRAVVDAEDAAPVVIASSWDAQKLDAIGKRQDAERVIRGAPTAGWDAQKLDAMQGRQDAELVIGEATGRG